MSGGRGRSRPYLPMEIRVGGIGSAATGIRPGDLLTIPVPERLMKEERRVLIWSGALEGRRTIFKAYLHSRRRIPSFWEHCVEREFEALRLLDEAGVACTPPVLWGAGWSPAYGRHEVLATQEIAGTISIRDGYRRGDVPLSPDLLAAVARGARTMHRIGIHHGAMSWKNVLASRSPDGRLLVHFVDLARSLRFGRDLAGSRMAWFDLLHFCYHLVDSLGAGLPKEVCLPFLEEYGLHGRSTARLFAALDRYRPEPKTPRRIRRLEFLLRLFLSRLRRR
jgi:tRNA A-37 threonylcarbamoyl transferase component Bud32